MLRSEKLGRPIVRLVVLLQVGKGKFKAQTLEESQDFLESIFIDIHLPGRVQEHDSDRAITLKLPGIERRFFEKSAGIFYWDKKRFQYIVTED